MSWWKRKPAARQAGSALFRGRWVMRPEDFAFLEQAGVRVESAERDEAGGWSAEIEHRDWGRATLLAVRDAPIPPAALLEMDGRLTDEEKAAVASCASAVAVAAEARTGNVLADRKDLLRLLHAVMGSEGIAAVDHTAQAFWSRAGLEDELAHDAELDIDAVYTMHLLYDREEEPSQDGVRRSFWLHSHGLKEMGFWDFDVLDPSPDVQGHAHELLRALAFGVVEGRLAPGGEGMPLVDGEVVRAVPAREFLSRATPRAFAEYQGAVDPEHLDGHAIICDPAPGWLQRTLRGDGPRPSRFLRGPFPEEVLIQFSTSATELMARRARQTIGAFRSLAEELAEFELPALVKLGYRVDGGGEDDREHLWFQVHGFQGDAVDATLVNAPFHVARLRLGDRGVHPLELLSDWTISTPIGPVNPRQTRTLRAIRDHRDELRAMLAASNVGGR